MKTVQIITLGCKVNQYESEAMAELFTKAGYKMAAEDEKADVIVVNTCTVTNLGDKKSRQAIRRAKQHSSNAIVAVCGCYSQVAPEEVAKINEVDIILGTKDRTKIVLMIEEVERSKKKLNAVEDSSQNRQFEPLFVTDMADRTRAYVKIQDGCRQFCSYCMIPYARGPIRSRALPDIQKEVQTLCEKGFQEIVLAGIHVASYGLDEQSNKGLIEVIRAVRAIEGVKRLRLSSIEPSFVTEEFLQEVSTFSEFCDHFHLSLQSGCDKILKKMNRKYNIAAYLEKVNLIKRYFPHAALWTDVIVGFPGETESDFHETLEFVRTSGLSKLHVFPYSPKKGTPAATFPDQIDKSIKSKRAEQLIACSNSLYEQFLQSQLGRETEVLFETSIDSASSIVEGHTTNYIKTAVQVKKEDAKKHINKIKIIKLKQITSDGSSLQGVLLPDD